MYKLYTALNIFEVQKKQLFPHHFLLNDTVNFKTGCSAVSCLHTFRTITIRSNSGKLPTYPTLSSNFTQTEKLNVNNQFNREGGMWAVSKNLTLIQ